MAKAKSEASRRIDAYNKEVADWAQPICTKLRGIVLKADSDIVEEWKWGGPTFAKDGLVCSYRAFKQHVAFHFFNGAGIADPEGLLESCPGTANARRVVLRDGKQVTQKRLLPFVKAAVALNATGVKPAKKRATIAMPPELKTALAKAPAAKKFYDGLTPGYRRDFCEHVAGAKRADTKTRRVKQVMEMLKAKRRLNDQYR